METINTKLDALSIVLKYSPMYNLTEVMFDDLLYSFSALNKDEKYQALFANYTDEFGTISEEKIIETLINKQKLLRNGKVNEISLINNSKCLIPNSENNSLVLITSFMNSFRMNIENRYRLKLDAIDILIKYAHFYNFKNIEFKDLLDIFEALNNDEKYKILFTNYIDEFGNISNHKVASKLANEGLLKKEDNNFKISLANNKKMILQNKEMILINSFMNKVRSYIEDKEIKKVNIKLPIPKVIFKK